MQLSAIEKSKLEKVREYLRLFTSDTEELNRLLRRKEISDKQMDLAIQLTISDWNTTTPRLGFVTLGSFPSFYLLIHGATLQMLKMAGIYQSRNELTYSSGGSSFIRANKTAYYQSWIQNLAADYEQKKLNLKIQSNVDTAMNGTGFHSEYQAVGYDW